MSNPDESGPRERSGNRRVTQTNNLAFRARANQDGSGEQFVQVSLLARLLMGAAHSDGDYAPEEALAIADLLSMFTGLDPLPDAVQEAMLEFVPEEFDLHAVCSELDIPNANDKREVLEMIGVVTDADEVVVAREGAYLAKVAEAMGLSREEYTDLLGKVEPPPVPPAG